MSVGPDNAWGRNTGPEPGIADQSVGLARVIDFIQSATPEELSKALTELTTAAAEQIPGAQYAGITLTDSTLAVPTPAMTNSNAVLLDAIQEQHREGPCIEAARTMNAVLAVDLTDDERWPAFRADALQQTPVRAVLSLPMTINTQSMGALNIYAERSAAFGDESVRVGSAYASVGALVWKMVIAEKQFREALQSRDVIGQAKGMLMERYSLNGCAAFNTLKKLSQDTNTPLKNVAARLVQTHEDDLHPPGNRGPTV